jgi:hypothetical protein
MTDDGKGGSGSGTGDANKTPAPENKIAKMSNDQVRAEYVAAKQELEKKDAIIANLKKNLDDANNVLEGQEKQRLIGEILPRSTFKADELGGKSIEDLKAIRGTLDMAMLPKVNSARFGSLEHKSERDTIGDLSYHTRKKREAQERN